MKSETVKIRLDIDEKRAFKKAADIAGISLSAWMRERLRPSAISELRRVDMTPAFLDKIQAKEDA